MNYKVIQTTVFPAVTKVHFYEETIPHINQEHPEVKVELPSIYQAVEQAIKDPTHIEQSYSNSYVYVDAKSTNAGGEALNKRQKLSSPFVSWR